MTIRPPRWAALLLLMLVGFAAPESRGDPIRYDFGGTITTADPSTGVTAGTPFSGTFAYDPTEKPSMGVATEGFSGSTFGATVTGVDAVTGQLVMSPPDSSGLSLNIGGQAVFLKTGTLGMNIDLFQQNMFGSPSNPFSSVNINSSDTPLSVGLTFTNDSAAVLASLAPPSTINLADFPSASLFVSELPAGAKDPLILYSGTITSLTAETPEPSTLLVVGLGAVGLWARGRRRAL